MRKIFSKKYDSAALSLLINVLHFPFQAYNVEETIAVSSQVMNSNNYRVVLEEILKVGNVQRSQLPSNIDSLPPAEQVKQTLLTLPSSYLGRGTKGGSMEGGGGGGGGLYSAASCPAIWTAYLQPSR